VTNTGGVVRFSQPVDLSAYATVAALQAESQTRAERDLILNQTKANLTELSDSAAALRGYTNQKTVLAVNTATQIARDYTDSAIPDVSGLQTKAKATEDSLIHVNNIKYGQPIIGEVTMFAGSNVPTNYLIADGRMLKKTDYPVLYSTIVGQFGENSDSFRLPNLTEKFVQGGTNRGQTGGADYVTLTESNLPSHTHAVTGEVKVAIADQQGNVAAGAGNVLGKVAQDTGTSPIADVEVYVSTSGRGAATFNEGNKLGGISHNLTSASVGSGESFSVLPSFIVLSYIIRVQ
jgi:microcystin-dependent protein